MGSATMLLHGPQLLLCFAEGLLLERSAVCWQLLQQFVAVGVGVQDEKSPMRCVGVLGRLSAVGGHYQPHYLPAAGIAAQGNWIPGVGTEPGEKRMPDAAVFASALR